VPLLRYSDAIKIKNLYPSLSIILNGGIDKIDIIKENINNFDGVMVGRRIYDYPLFLLEIESQIFGNNKSISTQQIIKEYAKYAMLRSNEGIKNYLLLRHLFNLYYNTNLSKKWKKFLHETIYNHEDVSNIIYFEEMYYEKKISTYG
jgi:tRNA-dihydrouridine synthase A